jgi:hypothetical protein
MQAAGRGDQPAPSDPVIENARAVTTSFLNHLPNYVCQEVITRYSARSREGTWRRQDEDGNEDYRNLTLNGHAAGSRLEELGGNWSRGEFATELAMLFSPVSDTQFQRRGEVRLGSRDALLYDYQVRQPRSLWVLVGPTGRVTPGYSGSIWIDRETGRLLRMEKRSDALPPEFAWATVESHTDYEFVRLGEEEALLPARSEIVSCQRTAPHCIRNVMEFRAFRKFAGESVISFK